MLSLTEAKNKTVGYKQTLKRIEQGLAQKVYIAKDAEEKILRPILELCQIQGIPVIEVESMAELGKASGIQVGSAVSAILKHQD